MPDPVQVLVRQDPDRSRCGPTGWERIWAIPLGHGLFRLNNIPACDPELNLHDVVVAEPQYLPGDDLKRGQKSIVVVGIHERGGHRTFDLHFRELGVLEFRRTAIAQALIETIQEDLGAQVESFSDTWYGVSIPRPREKQLEKLLQAALGEGTLDVYGANATTNRFASTASPPRPG